MDTQTLEPGERPYHVEVVVGFEKAKAVHDSWMGYLSRKYQLVEGDRIDLDGTIIRAGRRPSGNGVVEAVPQTVEGRG